MERKNAIEKVRDISAFSGIAKAVELKSPKQFLERFWEAGSAGAAAGARRYPRRAGARRGAGPDARPLVPRPLVITSAAAAPLLRAVRDGIHYKKN